MIRFTMFLIMWHYLNMLYISVLCNDNISYLSMPICTNQEIGLIRSFDGGKLNCNDTSRKFFGTNFIYFKYDKVQSALNVQLHRFQV